MSANQSQKSEASIQRPINEPNVIWSAEKNEDGSLKFGNPPTRVRISMTEIAVPAAEEQLKGFYSDHAPRLVSGVPGYKALQPKGEATFQREF